MPKKIKEPAYTNCATDSKGRKYILRSKCCLAPVYSTSQICGTCEVSPCEFAVFTEIGEKL